MLTKEEWEQLSEAEQEERIDEKPEDDPAQPGNAGVEEKPEDRPERNWEAEAKRKTGKIADLKEELANKTAELEKVAITGDTDKELNDELEAQGHDEETIKSIQKAVSKRVGLIEKKFAPLEKQVFASARDTHLTDIQKSDTTGMVKTYRDEIDEVLDEIDPLTWGSKKAVKSIVNMVLGNHINDVAGKKTVLQPSPTEIGGGGKGKLDGGSVSTIEMEETANELKISLNTPELKQKVKQLILARKKVEKQEEE